MAKTISSQITIDAPVQKVWKVLMNTTAYPEWNPFVKKLKGELTVGKKITVDLPGMKFKPTVEVLEENKEFRWQGHLLFPRIFDGQHQFLLEEINSNQTLFTHQEHFKGLLVPFLKKMLEGDTKKDFIAMNEALKKKCETL
ncbi:hypothetical protein SAMN05216474_0196 [Lishizhenia tianjinensis]|uniref:Polyketide cyclase / dehydrase and lipid transport n=1 Tax=Lishizhenia tianjinensis TaxID=477690 RepID=A0A1I6XGX3_9FLAO|nr:SRPBCC domain-containing protein [Lishizhenia tianjinensis]SFT37595.1 hypothetical protein SAMN05216474_0196 [Lishizhenia tianjinensis]